MADKRAVELIGMHGGFAGSKVLLDRLEYRVVDGRDGHAWDAEAWYGGDYSKLWIKTEGEGEVGKRVENLELQALWSRALDPWFNLQTGLGYQAGHAPDRAHFVLGIQGLAPYWFEIDAALLVSDRGDLTARFEAEYDQRLTQRLILQPHVEMLLAAQNVAALGVGRGLSQIEAGLRLRYEWAPEFAPYVGIAHERAIGAAADLARADGEDPATWSFVVGLRAWF